MPDEIIADEKVTLNSAISAAAESESSKDSTEVVDPNAETQDKEPEKTETKESNEGDLTPDEQAAARNLFRALKNPESAKATIGMLADSIGLSGKETPKQIETIKDSMVDILKESLGPDFEFLADKLAPGIKRLLTQEREEQAKELEVRTKDIRDNIAKTEQEKLQAEADITISSLANKYFGTDALPKDVEAQMSILMDKFQPSGKMQPKDYVESIFHMVAGQRGITPTTKDTRERIRSASTNVPSKLNSMGAPNQIGEKLPTKMSLTQAIEAAAETVLGKQ